MLSWASLWENVIQLELEFKIEAQHTDKWHVKTTRDTTEIAQWIQRKTGVYPATKDWAHVWLSDKPPPLEHAIEELKTALSMDGLQGEETVIESQPLDKDHTSQIILSADMNEFVKDCIKAYGILANDSQLWMSLLSRFETEQRGFTIFEGAMACELLKSHLFTLNHRIAAREYVTRTEEINYDNVMWKLFGAPSHQVSAEQWETFLDTVSDIKDMH